MAEEPPVPVPGPAAAQASPALHEPEPPWSSYFPYRLRPSQTAIVEAVHRHTEKGGVLLLDAPTGSGKTVSALAPLLAHGRRAGHKVLYLVRTHSQGAHVLSEVQAIARRMGSPILAVSLEGRQGRCLLLEDLTEMETATAEEFGKLCSDRKRATEKRMGAQASPGGDAPAASSTTPLPSGTLELTDLEGCPYYGRLLSSDLPTLQEHVAKEVPNSPRFAEWAKQENLCPYELAKRLARSASLVVAPYIFYFHPRIRRSLLDWMGVASDQVDLVVDEAHNLPEFLREVASLTLGEETISRARAELQELGDFPLLSASSLPRTARGLVEAVHAAHREVVDEFTAEEDGLLPPGVMEERLLIELGGTSRDLNPMLMELAEWGERLREERRKVRRLPRSYVGNVAETMLTWARAEPPEYVKVARKSPRRQLEAYALDAREAAAPVRACHLSVHMSGTLAPLEEYRDTLGLPEESEILTVPSPFPPEHRRLFYAPEVSSRHEEVAGDPDALRRLYDALVTTLRALPVKTAVFFPSFALLDRFLAMGLSSALPRGAVLESRSLSSAGLWKLVEGFKRSPGAGVLLGVCGGRIAEGIDFPDEELEAVVLVGVPFPRPTVKRQALVRYLDHTTGHGWEYAMRAPAQRAMLQALGRMIRSEHDRGLGVILDRRAKTFAAAMPGLEVVHELPQIAREFFRKGGDEEEGRGAPERRSPHDPLLPGFPAPED
ncbi:MAG: ATP-dependent DNA helicase [Euryarchaeota archaeon]|nr:ATP-dependent DNA helicase [Euryarchaeota archaeon]MDE1835819.1 ATP-dependent DNA helicase [Euryarchaeota archaeon]MDE1880530.1 ATP-dependent DNA helicase [Euryarchaeota archaeon]MDE2045793.1 ATP-dependent DNA helicase [Thermoplasmata archaeon]